MSLYNTDAWNSYVQGCQQKDSTDDPGAWGLGKTDTETFFKNSDGSLYVTYTGGQDTRYDNDVLDHPAVC